jgi:serine phosphatase RsbU (regulator of sigma subunit)
MCALPDSGIPQPIRSQSAEFPKMQGAEIAAAADGQRSGGDVYDIFRASPERILFGLLDVAGRREGNQAIVDKSQEIFRRLGAELFAPADINESESMVKLCLQLNRGIIEQAGGVHSCPAFIGCYHEKFGTLCYTNAGHTSGLLRDSTGIAELVSTGLPLGLFSHATCEAPTVGIEKGAALLVVSRGVIEGNFNGDGATDSSERDASPGLEFIKNQLKLGTGSARELCAAILREAVGSKNGSSAEDVTVLALLRTA